MKIQIVDGDDWCGLYIDGKLRYENHRIEAYDLEGYIPDLEVLGLDMDWLSDKGKLPENFEDVKTI